MSEIETEHPAPEPEVETPTIPEPEITEPDPDPEPDEKPDKTYTRGQVNRIIAAEVRRATADLAKERDEALSKLAKSERAAAIALLPEDRREKYETDESVSVEAIRILAAELKDAPKPGPRIDPAKLRPGALTAADRTAAARAAAVAALKASE